MKKIGNTLGLLNWLSIIRTAWQRNAVRINLKWCTKIQHLKFLHLGFEVANSENTTHFKADFTLDPSSRWKLFFAALKNIRTQQK